MSGAIVTLLAQCMCGEVCLETSGTPIMTVACYCESCQKAGHYLQSLPEAAPVFDGDGGTHFIMYRKDRVFCLNGQAQLSEHGLTPDTDTRRVVARCCNSPMFLEFDKGHWLSLYKGRFSPEDQPPLQILTMTMDRLADVTFNDSIPSPEKHTIGFMWRLMKAWAAMGFRTPKIDFVNSKMYNAKGILMARVDKCVAAVPTDNKIQDTEYSEAAAAIFKEYDALTLDCVMKL